MSTRGKFGRPWRRRNVVGATVIVAFVVVSLLTLGAASGRPAAQHSSGDRAAAGSAMSSTHLLSRAQADASLVSRSSSHASHQSLSNSSSSFGYSLFPALGSTSSSASRSLAATGPCPGGADSTIADASGFEDADGNLARDNATCMDWNLFTPTWTGTAPFETGTGSTNGFTFAGATDAFNSTDDSIYAGGVKQDTECPGTVTGKANDKADLAAIYISGERIGDQVYLFLSWERQLDTTVNSDVFVSFEFNQSKVSCGAGSPFVERTVGDVLFDYNFQSGNSTITAEQWDGTGWQPLATPPFEASVNQGTVTDTIRPDGPVDLTKFEFGEAGINLSELDLTGNGGKACETFGSVLGGSRTSQSGDTAQLKDFVGPAPLDVSNCVQPTATTTLKNAANNNTIPNGSSIPFGSSVYDTATLGNLVTGQTPTGTVQYTFFTNGDCSGTGTSAGLKTLNLDGSVPNSDTQGPLAAGNYSFNAQYLAGNDQNYSDSEVSACEPFTVLKTSPTISTLLSESTGNVGDSVHDSATISGATADAGGTVKYAFYSSLSACNAGTFATPGGTSLGTKTVTNGSVPDSDSTGPINAAGSYYFRAFYSGDNNNNGAFQRLHGRGAGDQRGGDSYREDAGRGPGECGRADRVHLDRVQRRPRGCDGCVLDGHAADECRPGLVDRLAGCGLELDVRDRGGCPLVWPGDGAGRDDAGRLDVHRAHHLADDDCDGWCLSGGQRCSGQHRPCDDHERRLGRLDRFDLCGGAGDPHREDGGRGPGERGQSDRVHVDRLQRRLG